MGQRLHGVIEGFYGTPWGWDRRVEVMRFCAERGLGHYLYAPKSDPLHREQWRTPYPDTEIGGFTRLAEEGGVTVGFGISPGLSIDPTSAEDRAALGAKVDQVIAAGVGLIGLLLDDIPVRPGLGEEHAALTTWLHEHLDDRAALVMCPTEYTGTRSTPYLAAIAAGVPEDVPIFWTGSTVVCDHITNAEAHERAEALAGRPPLVWDNYPVNDATMTDRLFLGPVRGREPGLAEACAGWFANPMIQPRASKLPLASVAAFLRWDDPVSAWEHDADALGWRVLAEGCDGVHPNDLVTGLEAAVGTPQWGPSLDLLETWLDAAGSVTAPGLDDEAGPWIDQLRDEASLGRTATRLIQSAHPVVALDAEGRGRVAPPDTVAVAPTALALAVGWGPLRRSTVCVLGPRLSVRPVLGQDADGEWVFHRASIDHDRNALDRLVVLALDVAERCRAGDPLDVHLADGTPVEVAADGSFTAPPGVPVTARCGPAATAVEPGGGPPLPERRLAPPTAV